MDGARAKAHEIIFEADTPAGKLFDVVLLVLIFASVVVVMLDTVKSIAEEYGTLLLALEWIFTVIFTVEYVLRLWCVGKPARYAFSFFGVVDLLAVAPTYVSLVLPGAQYLLVIRLLRMLRIFRVLKLVQYIGESNDLMKALKASRHKITVFVFSVLIIVVIVGALMYVIEPEAAGFTSIPTGMYWAIVTLTTVGYGDIAPVSALGKTLAAFIMIMGYGIIAVPTGIVTAELTRAKATTTNTLVCQACHAHEHDDDAVHCKHCGGTL
ncbi:MAG: ion transporter [Planctomycetota bacterium]|jgi:voltage-gated potassium channel